MFFSIAPFRRRGDRGLNASAAMGTSGSPLLPEAGTEHHAERDDYSLSLRKGFGAVITLRVMFFSVAPFRRRGDRGLNASAAMGTSGSPLLPEAGTEHHAERDDYSLSLRKGFGAVITLRVMFFSVAPFRRRGDRGLNSSAAMGTSGTPLLPEAGTEHHAERDDYSLSLRKGFGVVITLRVMFFSVAPFRRRGDRGLNSSAAMGTSATPLLPKAGTEHHAERAGDFPLPAGVESTIALSTEVVRCQDGLEPPAER